MAASIDKPLMMSLGLRRCFPDDQAVATAPESSPMRSTMADGVDIALTSEDSLLEGGEHSRMVVLDGGAARRHRRWVCTIVEESMIYDELPSGWYY